jgi:hypothetical protein
MQYGCFYLVLAVLCASVLLCCCAACQAFYYMLPTIRSTSPAAGLAWSSVSVFFDQVCVLCVLGVLFDVCCGVLLCDVCCVLCAVLLCALYCVL